MGSAIDALIASAPRQHREWTVQAERWTGLMRKTGREIHRVAQAASLDIADAVTTATLPRAQTPRSDQSWNGDLDRLINAAPRQQRTWTASGGVLVDPHDIGQSPKLAATVGKAHIGSSLSKGGLGAVMNAMIAEAPRQERTYDWNKAPVSPEQKKRLGRFTTSKSSGS